MPFRALKIDVAGVAEFVRFFLLYSCQRELRHSEEMLVSSKKKKRWCWLLAFSFTGVQRCVVARHRSRLPVASGFPLGAMKAPSLDTEESAMLEPRGITFTNSLWYPV